MLQGSIVFSQNLHHQKIILNFKSLFFCHVVPDLYMAVGVKVPLGHSDR